MFQKMDDGCASEPIPSCIIQSNGIGGKCGSAPWVSNIAVKSSELQNDQKGHSGQCRRQQCNSPRIYRENCKITYK